MKTLLPIVVILVLVVGGLLVVKSQVGKQVGPAAPTEGAGAPAIQVGATLPDFELYTFPDGKAVKASELPSKVTLINFWATWCEACMVEMPSIAQLRETYKDKGFEVAAVNMDQNPAVAVPRTVKKLGLQFPIYTDRDSKLADLFQIQAIPLTVIVDKNRKILFIETGERDWNGADIRAQLERWLAG